MATASVLTPIKSRRDGIFSSRLAGGRMPLSPSPSTPKTAAIEPTESIHHGNVNLMSRFSRSVSKTNVRDSPKSNIASRHPQSPRRLDTFDSDFTLTGTGPRPSTATSAKNTPSRSKSGRSTSVHRTPKRSQGKINYTAADRFIPNRDASEAISSQGAAVKLDGERTPGRRPKSIASDGSAALAASVSSAFDLGRSSTSDATASLSLEGLNLNDEDDDDEEPKTKPSPNTVAYQHSVAEACGVSMKQRILAFKPAAPESSRPIDLRSQYNRPLKPTAASASQFRRRVLTAPERVLDAPGLVDDYYLNLLDWSSGNQVAIGLERDVYVWSAESGSVSSLLQCPEDTYIASVKWSGDGAYVAAGLGTGEVQIWDVEEGTKLRSMYGHDTRVSVMGWNKHLLSTGARSGLVYNHDVRIAQHKVAELVSHTSEVCGLEWRADGAQLATGGNDNLVTIWDARALNAPKFQKTNHKAAIKALAWCPWQSNLLATGGGSHDRMIHFWNTTSGARTNSIDTGSQVTSLRWSTAYKELVSSSGFPDNSLSIWSYPTLVKNIEIPAHESRVLHSALSPDGQMLATAAADESLKFWKVFEKKPGQASLIGGGSTTAKAGLTKATTIR
ncbi:WD repeat-containing protein slp1 [Fulvia fulva]|uniref:WD repeat-containing protein slp1 n=1 Tax=Passalora fulva TaxID=5499 RepID=A0A9Q8LE22_PASFU|nr:WD repeat-containing protein slp1 [Fulvia fulva]KAK4627083.1 WD repeat-containing protein slp1 [Fulvia fulva]KAK4627830.1 WD repeat-containing protein slp1 [Fulvia fulva]UJO15742.1 WD repeat-containing protein slp1 [Fulvia fulva]WPV13590.1 WD repeat-containing protein slp1 [Fulvia fulva]WPV28820.1 WD repeat-containing protein slp1 [Fulvia fulva]